MKLTKAIVTAIITLFPAGNALALEQDFVTWTRVGTEIGTETSPLSLEVDGQLRLDKFSSQFQSFQARSFLNLELDNNTLSLGYLVSRGTEKFSHTAALQYTNDFNAAEKLNLETRIRLEKRILNEEPSDNLFRSRLRLGVEYSEFKPVNLLVNNEFFFTERTGFTENRSQAGIIYDFTNNISLELFYQNRFLPEEDKLEHAIFSNLGFKIGI